MTTIPKPTILPLTVRSCASVRSVYKGGGIQTAQFCAMLALFEGSTVEAQVYSGTNKCFEVTEKMILDAWDKLDKEKYYWVNEDIIPDLVERFTTVNEYGNKLSMSLPNLFCKETPAEIEEMLRACS